MRRSATACVLLLRTRESAERQVLRELRYQAVWCLDRTGGDCSGITSTGIA